MNYKPYIHKCNNGSLMLEMTKDETKQIQINYKIRKRKKCEYNFFVSYNNKE